MPPERTFHYEAMFLVGQSSAADLGAVITHIDELLGRCEAKLVSMAKWDERRLAFEIEKQKRGLYILTYFEAPAQKISQLDRDCQMSETIMRLLVTRADHLTMEEMQAADGREALMSEAKLRAEKASEDQEQAEDTSVRMGRPVEEAPAEQPAEGSGDGASADAEPTAEGEAAEPAANA
ncbi:MAG: 30S ribosomal protein S6 [Phycisphaerales bacterium]|nr:30S ribosomal protein S6 [Phycisphaerales bacterium]